MKEQELKALFEGQTIEQVGFYTASDDSLALDWILLANGRVFRVVGQYGADVSVYESDVEAIGGPTEE